MYVQSDVGVGYGDVGSVSRVLTELVYDGILDLIGYKAGVSEFLGVDHGVYGEGLPL